MSDVTRNYGINYTAKTDQAKSGIAGLSAEVLKLDQRSRDGTNELAALARQAEKGAPQLQAAARALSALSAVDLSKIRGVAGVIGEIGDGLTFARQEASNLKGGLDGLAGSNRPLGGVAATVGRIGDNAMRAARNIGDVGVAMGTAGAQKGALDGVAVGVEKVQRKGYGAKKNIEELNVALAGVGANTAGLNQAAGAAGQLAKNAGAARTALRGSAGASRSLGRGLLSVAAGMTAVSAARRAATAIGDQVNDWRAKNKDEALRAVALQDTYREVANLQGKAAPDSETVGTALKLRIASGMSDSDADKFLRRWYGSLPAGRDKGNIDDATAGRLQGIAGALGIRTGMDAGTAGDLAASLANYGKVPNETAAAGQLGVIVDRLNEGRGDLTPLTNALLKTAGTTVGPKGSAFADLGELAAVLGVASNNASPSAAGTMIQQTMRGLSLSGKKSDGLLNAANIGGGDDFLTRVEKIAPFIARAEADGVNPMDYLRDQGFGNVTDRRGIVYFARNAGLIRQRIDATRAARGADAYAGAGASVESLNRRFLASDVARGRVAGAMSDAADYTRYVGGAEYEQKRIASEADLVANHGLDSLGKRVVGSVLDGFGVLPALGFKSTRQSTIDRHIDSEVGGIPAMGSVPAGTAGIERKLDTLIDETRRANLQRAGQAAPPLPARPRVDPLRP
jgi:hypothetical protein